MPHLTRQQYLDLSDEDQRAYDAEMERRDDWRQEREAEKRSPGVAGMDNFTQRHRAEGRVRLKS